MSKAGLKSSELWFSVAAFIAGALLTATGADGGMAQVIGGIMMAISPAA